MHSIDDEITFIDSWRIYSGGHVVLENDLMLIDEKALSRWHEWESIERKKMGLMIEPFDGLSHYLCDDPFSRLWVYDQTWAVYVNELGYENEDFHLSYDELCEAIYLVNRTESERIAAECDYEYIHFMNRIGYLISLIPQHKYDLFRSYYTKLCEAEILSDDQVAAINDICGLLSQEIEGKAGIEIADIIDAVSIAIKEGLLGV